MFAVAWQYLTGLSVSSDFDDRTRPEWPPHPDRLFQALVATWAERGGDGAERRALEWIESLGPPLLVSPEADPPEEVVSTYVPTNDIESTTRSSKKRDYADKLLGLLPLKRTRKERAFPSVWVGDGICRLQWPDANVGAFGEPLATLCSNLIRVGHSSSFVRCWVDDASENATHEPVPPGQPGNMTMRVPTPGRLQTLIAAHEAALRQGVYSGTPPAREVVYRRVMPATGVPATVFSPRLIAFRKADGPPLSLAETLPVTSALRATLIRAADCTSARALEIVSGHTQDGSALEVPHLAYIPLGFVGSTYADGRLMGVGLATPSALSGRDERDLMHVVAKALDAEGRIKLKLGPVGVWTIEPVGALLSQRTLQAETWTRPSTVWASATPIVMDLRQNRRRGDPDGWARSQVRAMCVRIGLPEPAYVSVGHVSHLSGAPPARSFRPIRRKDGSTRRMVHTRIEFDEPVRGPIILGSGRYRGYGVCRPLHDAIDRRGTRG